MATCLRSMWPAATAMLHSVYDQPSTSAVNEQIDRLPEYPDGRLPDVAWHLGDGREGLLAFSVFPDVVRRQIWSNHPTERLNREFRRRTDVVGIFPNCYATFRFADTGITTEMVTDDLMQLPA